jgi:hypothetical protein
MLEYNRIRERVNLAITKPNDGSPPEEETKSTSPTETTSHEDPKNNEMMQKEIKVDKSKAKEITVIMKHKTGEENLKEDQEKKEENIRNEFWNHLQDFDKQKNGSKREIYVTDNPTVEKRSNQTIIVSETRNPKPPPESTTKEYEYLDEYEEDDAEGQNVREEMWNDFENERDDSIDAWEEMIKERDKAETIPKIIQEIPNRKRNNGRNKDRTRRKERN